PVEVHCYYTTRFLITLHRAPSPALDGLRREASVRPLLGLQASLAGNHLAAVSRRLAAVATIFLPISFLAKFWGQNFTVLTGTLEKGWGAFLILGVGLTVACVLVTIFILRCRRWT
ncbi:MAG: hypothetical protein JO244_13915, partial [Solirubrobacterales bacterium]|nr:hypothetical protein [Solirubrobacterales bacterium]